MKVNHIILLFSILFIAIFASFLSMPTRTEGFENAKYLLGDYPSSEQAGILPNDMFPSIGHKGVSNYQEQKMWWHYPVFKVGSYAQITNNIRYSNNPDEGTCMPADFCGSFYKDKKGLPSNYTTMLPPVKEDESGSRVGYFNAPTNMMPFTNQGNILY